MMRDTGFEPVTPTVSGWCSTAELTARCKSKVQLVGWGIKIVNLGRFGKRFLRK